MPYKSLLMHVEQGAQHTSVIDTGLRLAIEFGAHLTALHLYVPSHLAYAAYAEYPVWGGVTALQREVDQARRHDASLKAEFEELADRSGASQTEWRFHSGELAETVALHGRYADLVLLGQHDPRDKASRSGFDTPAEVALLSSRPVLILPYDTNLDTLGKRVVLAWNASREVTRAAAAALPLLKRAQAVDVVVVESEGQPHGEEPGADIALYLSRHGVKASVMRLPPGELRVSETLLSAVAERGADLLCMGVYGHPRLRELVLGGTTYELMRHMTVPTLIAC